MPGSLLPPKLDLEELDAGPFEACSVRGDPVALAGGLEHIAPVEGQRRDTQVSSARVVAVPEEAAGRGGRSAEHGEPVDICGVGSEA
jgi:hypothetical protein